MLSRRMGREGGREEKRGRRVAVGDCSSNL
jgi:hypothetical protein